MKADIQVASSPYGPDDQLGALNQITAAMQACALERADAARIYDLSIDYFVACRASRPPATRPTRST